MNEYDKSYRKFIDNLDEQIAKQSVKEKMEEMDNVENMLYAFGDIQRKRQADRRANMEYRLLMLCGSYVVREEHMEHIDLTPLFDEKDIPSYNMRNKLY
jgi:hypothetical protein